MNDRPKGSQHPRYPGTDYGYLSGTLSMDGIWRGAGSIQQAGAVICSVDIAKQDVEIKIKIGCTEEETETIYRFHNASESMKGLLIRRNQ